MKILRVLALGGAAVLTVVRVAQAADLPSRKAAPVEYVKVCDAYGAGFFYIPGTDTCLEVGGYVRATYEYVPGQNIVNVGTGAVSQAAQDQTGMEFRGRIELDARTQTVGAPFKPPFDCAPPIPMVSGRVRHQSISRRAIRRAAAAPRP